MGKPQRCFTATVYFQPNLQMPLRPLIAEEVSFVALDVQCGCGCDSREGLFVSAICGNKHLLKHPKLLDTFHQLELMRAVNIKHFAPGITEPLIPQ